MTPEALQRKLDELGITERDWVRIKGLVDQVAEGGSPPALWDLDSTYAVAAVRLNPNYPASDRIGVITLPDGLRVALIYWKISDHELWKQGRGKPPSPSPRA